MATKRLTQLEQQRAALDAKIKAAKARQKAQDRKTETRRKVLAGAAVLYRAETDKAYNAELLKLLDNFLTRDDERALFDLSPRKDEAQAA